MLWWTLKQLRSPDTKSREVAIKRLIDRPSAKALDLLLASLEDSQVSIQALAAEALGKLRSPVAVQALLSALERGSALVQAPAAAALGEIGDPMAAEPLSTLLRGNALKPVRIAAVVSLGQLKTDAALPSLIRSLVDYNPEIRTRAEQALKGFPNWHRVPAAREVASVLIPMLASPHEETRSFATRLLQQIDPHWEHDAAAQRAIPDLIIKLVVGKVDNAKLTESTLQRITPAWERTESARGVVPTLIPYLTNNDPRVREEADRVLQKIDSNWRSTRSAKEAISALIPKLLYPKSSVRDTARNILHLIDEDWEKSEYAVRAIPVLSKALEDANPIVSQAAADLLVRIDPDRYRQVAASKVSKRISDLMLTYKCNAAVHYRWQSEQDALAVFAALREGRIWLPPESVIARIDGQRVARYQPFWISVLWPNEKLASKPFQHWWQYMTTFSLPDSQGWKANWELDYDEQLNYEDNTEVLEFFLSNDHASKQTTTSSNDGPVELKRQIVVQPVGRNDLCSCGSGQKYKNCHGKLQ